MADDWRIDRWKIGRWSVTYLLTLCSLFGLIFYGLVRCASSSYDTSATASTRTKKIEALVYCKELVTNSLKAPSTADFPWVIEAKAVGGDVYAVDSYVDAQNSFGAMIRTHFTCQLKYTGDGKTDSWVVKVFKVLE